MKAPARYNWAFSSSVCVKAEIQFGFVPPDSTPVLARSGQSPAHSGAAVARSQPGLPGWAIRGVLSGPLVQMKAEIQYGLYVGLH